MNAIEFQNIKKTYGDKTIIGSFSLAIGRGEFVTIIGTSGSGKTTLVKMVNRLVVPDSGTVWINGEDIQDKDPVLLRRGIGYAIQGSVLFPHMTVEENIAYVPNLWNKSDKKRTASAVSKWMKIAGLADELRQQYPYELSGGEQQRVGIARALAASPPILLMDEPFGAVDEITRKQLQKELKDIYEQTGITVLFITHDISEALALGTKVLVLDKGALQQYDTPDNILNHPANAFVAQLVGDRKGSEKNRDCNDDLTAKQRSTLK